MFRDKPIQYPDKNPVLGRYLGPAIDVGPEMTANIVRVNVEVLHWSTYHGLKEDYWTNQVYVFLRKDFDSNIKNRFGSDISPDDFPDVNLEDAPLYEIYEEDTTDVGGVLTDNTEDDEDPDMAHLLDCEVSTPEVNENYVNASVIFPIGNSYARGKVVVRKIDADGNAVGRGNENPILDTREYRVEFDDG